MKSIEGLLELNEGRSRVLYKDTNGNFTIGVGHNISANGLDDSTIDFILNRDIYKSTSDLIIALPWIIKLDPVRLAAVQDLCFNMGIGTLLTFKNTLAYAASGNWTQVAINLKRSKWFNQVGVRGPRIIKMFLTGQWPEELK